jgi:hypothetical protein
MVRVALVTGLFLLAATSITAQDACTLTGSYHGEKVGGGCKKVTIRNLQVGGSQMLDIDGDGKEVS